MYMSRTKGNSTLSKLRRGIAKVCSWLWGQVVIVATYDQVRFRENGKLLYEGPLAEMPREIREKYNKFQAEMAVFKREMTGDEW